MQLLWVDDSFPPKDKTNNYQLDSSRTTDSISNIHAAKYFPEGVFSIVIDFNSFIWEYHFGFGLFLKEIISIFGIFIFCLSK